MAAGAIAIVAGGLLAAAVAHAPGRTAVWLSAFLVLVVGVVQVALAAGQVLLAGPGAGRGTARCELALYNLGGAGVIAGTLAGSFVLVALGTGVFLAALATFLLAVRYAPTGPGVRAHRAPIAVVGDQRAARPPPGGVGRRSLEAGRGGRRSGDWSRRSPPRAACSGADRVGIAYH
ncbi:MAG: hypothetical protein U5K43_07295 [Halofilum sp. (in: g-proteobacteria)]|nr:hypothetical protein [Halofilum sp. (in: g-proteobacteria)]